MGNTVEKTYDILKGTDDGFQAIIGICVAIFVVLMAIVFFALRGRSSRRQSILLVGLSDSGKTTLYSKLVHEMIFSTHTSFKENRGDYIVPTKKNLSLNVIDIPGHEKLRYKFFDQFKATARAVIFVVDSVTFQKDYKDVAELMYNVLTDATVVQNALPMLVACNKHDQALPKGPTVISTALEKELNNVRQTRSASLSTMDGQRKSNSFLGRRNQDFTFADVNPIRVEFVKCSARGGKSIEDGLFKLKEWIARIA